MGSLARLEFDELEPALAKSLEGRVSRLGYLGEFFKCAGHQPAALRDFMAFTESAKGGLAPNLVEIVALTAAGWASNDYERNQHERLSVRLGLGRDWVAAVGALAPDNAPGLSSAERLVQRLVLTVLKTKGRGALADFEQAVDALGDAPAIAVLMLLGRYVVHALFVNTLELAPPVPSIFEDGFAA
ncbi:MAG: hypothetical protein JWR80_5273 [Bradyrhizobium sp.]|nr:hypothetical protein [Bradyrhizobium sp.]